MESEERKIQKDILLFLDGRYPDVVAAEEIPWHEHKLFRRCLSYLDGHGLVEVEKEKILGDGIVFYAAQITPKGIDFLAEDGGLSAILGVVTIKIPVEDMRQLLLLRVDESPLPLQDKSKLAATIKGLPGAFVGEAVKRLASLAIENASNVPDLIRSIVS